MYYIILTLVCFRGCAIVYYAFTNRVRIKAVASRQTSPLLCYIYRTTLRQYRLCAHGSLTRYAKFRVVHAPGILGRFPRHWFRRKQLASDPGSWRVSHARTVMHVGIVKPRWREKRSRHSRLMRHLQFHVSGKRPMKTMPISCESQYARSSVGLISQH